MEILEKTDVKDIIKQLPFIDLSDRMEYDNCGATYKNEDHEIEAGTYFLLVDMYVEIDGNMIAGDYFNEPQYTVTDTNIKLTVKNVWLDEDEIELTDSEYKVLEKEIKQNINI